MPKGAENEADQAIQAAEGAFESWANLTAYDRANYLMKLNDLLLEAKEEMAKLMTLELGKPITESRGEVQYGASRIKWLAEEGQRNYGQTVPAHVPNKRMQVRQKHLGVVAAITPWHFPLVR